MKKKSTIIIVILLFLSMIVVGSYIALKNNSTDKWIMTQYSDASGNQGLFYSFYNKGSDVLILIDGGWKENADQVRQVINSHGKKVDYWFVTHYHNDHVDAVNEILKDPQGIKIGTIYDSQIDYEKYISVAKEWDTPESLKSYLELTKDMDNIVHLKRDNELTIGNLCFKIFNAYDKNIKYQRKDLPNSLSLMIKVQGQKDSILFCADCHEKRMAKKLIKRYGEDLKAEYVQLGHHGNNSFPESFYEHVDPKIALFDGPAWLVESDDYTAKALMKYFMDKGVTCYDYRTKTNQFNFE